jgi:hypothetical protein
MRDTWVVGLAAIDRLEYRRRTFLIGVRPIRRWRGRDQSECIKKLYLVVSREARRD